MNILIFGNIHMECQIKHYNYLIAQKTTNKQIGMENRWKNFQNQKQQLTKQTCLQQKNRYKLQNKDQTKIQKLQGNYIMFHNHKYYYKIILNLQIIHLEQQIYTSYFLKLIKSQQSKKRKYKTRLSCKIIKQMRKQYNLNNLNEKLLNLRERPQKLELKFVYNNIRKSKYSIYNQQWQKQIIKFKEQEFYVIRQMQEQYVRYKCIKINAIKMQIMNRVYIVQIKGLKIKLYIMNLYIQECNLSKITEKSIYDIIIIDVQPKIIHIECNYILLIIQLKNFAQALKTPYLNDLKQLTIFWSGRLRQDAWFKWICEAIVTIPKLQLFKIVADSIQSDENFKCLGQAFECKVETGWWKKQKWY